ncbi:MAG: YbhB/YbcL family Raf kinase inhibitor-like protein [Gammaproteobacteria bacterium]|nr:YbhB/YbcL family Raf kinase inhibitor-like protein [Gammaproteobacteria bacterium]MBU0772003.1 YbhB/YbcL family Raf kinase inhibitor-like protein [Gammaproteobacteria bacterium]MBU0857031.1 YbhB/YbcL family Raf kinase inhibitor-like protein [Gammaproteobacteria bacterium]MBU1845764.1 YbhB/YbcL family Raf kinase inhibitor-like protein [Gammaproteobacteria bacterium]
MKLISNNLADGGRIAGGNAFCIPADSGHACLGENRNPHLAWSGLPTGTRSLVLICNDPDVPSRPDDVNQEGRTVPASLPRTDFTHWVLVDLPPAGEIAEGEFSSEVTPCGKPGPAGPRGTRQGINSFTAWFAGDEQMKGDYYGYDGPCPPWNDEIIHHYTFTLYALDVERLPLVGRFEAADVHRAMAGHVLGEASLAGTYTLNPALGD